MSEGRSVLRGEVEVAYKKTSETFTLDRRVFNICETKEDRFGLIKRKIVFVHFDGKTWNILHANEDFTEVKHYKLR